MMGGLCEGGMGIQKAECGDLGIGGKGGVDEGKGGLGGEERGFSSVEILVCLIDGEKRDSECIMHGGKREVLSLEM